MADHNDKDISEAAAKLYACKFEALPISGELSSRSIILPMDTTWYIDSANFPNAPPPSMRDSCSVSKQWWEEPVNENSNECSPNACHEDSTTPKNIAIKVSIKAQTYQSVTLLSLSAYRPNRQPRSYISLALHWSVGTVVCMPEPHCIAVSGSSSDPLSIGKLVPM